MVKNVLKRGAGKSRNYWGIRVWLSDEEITMTRIAKEVGVAQYTVSSTIRGFSNNRLVLKRLRDLGCPDSLLGLPRDMLEETNAGDQG